MTFRGRHHVTEGAMWPLDKTAADVIFVSSLCTQMAAHHKERKGRERKGRLLSGPSCCPGVSLMVHNAYHPRRAFMWHHPRAAVIVCSCSTSCGQQTQCRFMTQCHKFKDFVFLSWTFHAIGAEKSRAHSVEVIRCYRAAV